MSIVPYQKAFHLLLSAVIGVVFLSGTSLAQDRFSKEHLLGKEEMPWQISAKTLSYAAEEGVISAEGDVVITKEDRLLRADRARYNEKTGIAEVEGDVRFEIGKDVLTGKRGFFDLKNQTGQISEGHLFLSQNHYFLHADVIDKVAEDTYVIKNGRVTTCDGDRPDWTITGSEIKVTLEGYGTVKHAAFRVRGMPLLYVPYLVFPAKTERQTGLLPPGFGYSNRNGFDGQLPFFWAISNQMDATFYQRYMSERGYMQGLEFRYLSDPLSKGFLLFDILSDKKDKKDLNDPDEVELSPQPRTNETRYWFRGRAEQDLPLGFEARLDADYVSDQDYLKEFETELFGFNARPDLNEESGRPVEEKFSPTRRSALRISHDGEGYSLQMLGSYHQRPENPPSDTTPQPLGGVHFSYLPKQIGGFPVFFNLGSEYDYIWRDVGQKGHSLSFFPEITAPLWLGPYMVFEPSVKYDHNSQWLEGDFEYSDRQTRSAYETTLRLTTNLERTYDFQWRETKRLKHRIRPSLSYSYRAPQDEGDFSPWFEPIEEKGKINRLAFSVESFLDARLENERQEVRYRQWANLTLVQGYNMDEERRHEISGEEKRPFEPLSVLLTLKPYTDLDLFGQAEWDHYDHEITLADLSLDLSMKRAGGRKDHFSIDYRLEKGIAENLSFSANAYLAYGFSVGGTLQRDLDLGENIWSSIWTEYQRQCWGVRLGVERVDEETSIMVSFKLLGLGDFKAL